MFEHRVNVPTNTFLDNNEITGYGIALLDTLLLMRTRKGDYFYEIYDLKSRRPIKSFGKEGRGPEEYLHAPKFVFQSPEHGKLKFFYRDRLDIYSVDSLLHSENYLPASQTIPECPPFFNLTQVNQNTIIGIGYFEQGLYGIIHDGKFTNTYFDYPVKEKYNNYEHKFIYISYQGFLVSHPSDDKCVMASRNGGVLQFLSVNNGTPVIKNQIITSLPDILTKTEGRNVLARATNDTRGYRGLAVTADFVYVVYSDIIPEPGSLGAFMRSQHGRHLLVFDWEGNPLIHFSLNESVIGLIVDQNDEYAYCSTPMGDIVQIPLFMNSHMKNIKKTK